MTRKSRPPTEPPIVGEAAPELPDLLVDLDPEPPPPPQNAPIFAHPPETYRRHRANGVDEVATYWHVAAFRNGQRVTLKKVFPPNLATVETLERNFPSGTYTCMLKNAANVLLETATHTIEGLAEGPPPPAPGSLADSGAPRSGSMLDRVMEMLLIRALDPPKPEPPREDPMREAMAMMVKSMAVQQQMQAQAMQLQMQMTDRQNAPAAQASDRMFSLLEKMTTSKPNGNGGGTLAELMPLLTLGINLGSRMAGGGAGGGAGGEPAEKKNEWLEMVPELADSLGVPLIVALSQTLPEAKAKEALRAIEEHMKARQAEAHAATAAAANPIDTSGTEVP
jgi:hypothetical protein